MDKLKMQSADGVARNVEKIGELFPNAVTEVVRNGKVERVVDFEVLQQELSDVVVKGREERYQFTWPGKKEATLKANLPISAVLRPIKEESVGCDGASGGFDSENLYIEGDNLEVLKLLRANYLSKVKMIYIDPPYNTGKDFVYNDDFAQSANKYMENSGQFDEQGNRMEKNLESNGRFHSYWCSMIYPRLKLAKDLLSEDGAIFISIGDDEEANLIKICNEILGERNFIANICHQHRASVSNDRIISENHNHLIFYAKNISVLFEQRKIIGEDPILEGFNLIDEKGKYKLTPVDGPGGAQKGNPYYEFLGIKGYWRYSKKTMQEKYDQGLIVRTPNGLQQKYYLSQAEKTRQTVTTWWDKDFLTSSATRELSNLMRGKVFDNPKNINLVLRILKMMTKFAEHSIILDFFSGSATTAHAVMQLNAEDGGKRKFIMVQIPEKCGEKSEAFKAGYKNICEIGKERIRRAGKKIKEENPLATQDLDVGFRCLRLDTSNMKDVYYKPEKLRQEDLFAAVDNVKEDRSPEDLLFQVMPELGADFSSKIEEKEFGGKKVFCVEDNYLVACFDENVTEETVMAMAMMKPNYAVLRDKSMKDDSVAVNFEQIFKTYSSDTELRVL